MDNVWYPIAYGRTSKDDNRRLTIEIQQHMEARWKAADTETGPFVFEEWDAGVSGKVPFPDRPGGRRILDYIASNPGKRFLLVVCYIDRFARDTLSGIGTAKVLNDQGTFIASINEGLDARRERSPFQFNLRLCFAEEEWHRIRERFEEGKSRAKSRDKAPPGGGIQFGYKMGPNGVWHLDELEAPLVVRCFEMILEGKGQMAVSAWLRSIDGLKGGHRYQKRNGAPATYVAGDGPRRFSQVFVGKLLHSRAYIGERKWGKDIFHVPAIVPLELWEEVQRITARRRQHLPARADRLNPALLSGLIRCGTCGGPVHGILKHSAMNDQVSNSRKRGNGVGGESGLLLTSTKTYQETPPPMRVYRCLTKAIAGRSCGARQFKAADLDAAVWELLRSYLANPGELLAKAVSGSADRSADLVDVHQEEAALQADLVACEVAANDVWAMQRRQGLPYSFVERGLADIQERRQAVLQALNLVRERRLAAEQQRQECAAVAQAVQGLKRLLPRAEDDPALRAEIARELVKDGVARTLKPGKYGSVEVKIRFRWGQEVNALTSTESGRSGKGKSDNQQQSQLLDFPQVLTFTFTLGAVAS
jgi:DNA invertase Pin-like site-specific DNA recombinase